MASMLFRIVEITFTAYVVPALLVPLAWVAAWTMRRRQVGILKPSAEVEGQARLLFSLFALWVGLFLAVAAGAPFARGGLVAVAACWLIYAVTNLLLAWFLIRFTSLYGMIPAGQVADRVFMRFIGVVVAQPLMTAAAFAVLNNVMGLAWNAQMPELPAIQEGI